MNSRQGLAAAAVLALLAGCTDSGTTREGQLVAPGSTVQQGALATPSQGPAKVSNPSLVVQPFNMTVEKIQRMDVVTRNGEKVGDIANVLADNTGRVTHMTITSGGFLGLGSQERVIPLSELQLRGNQFVTSMSRQDIERLPSAGTYGDPRR